MIHVRVGKSSYDFPSMGVTYIVNGNILLFNYRQYDTIIINNAHLYKNLMPFLHLCKKYNKLVYVGGLINDITVSTLKIADTFVKEC